MHKKNIEKLKKGIMVEPVDSSTIVERAIDIHLARMRRLKDLHEMKLFRAENILFKKKLIEQQNRLIIEWSMIG